MIHINELFRIACVILELGFCAFVFCAFIILMHALPVSLHNILKKKEIKDTDTKPDWNEKCMVCEAVPTLPITGMCGPCTFGEAETHGGNW